LAARYSACCKARTGSSPDPTVVELAETALTRPLLTLTTHRRSSGPSLTGGSVVRPAQPVLRPPPTPFRQATRFPRSGEGLSSSRRHYRYVPHPIRRRVPRHLHLQVFGAFHGLHRDFGGSALSSPAPQRDGPLTTPQASLHAADRILAPPEGLSTLGSDPTRFQMKPPVCYRATLAATRTGLTPASDDELTNHQSPTRGDLLFCWTHGINHLGGWCFSRDVDVFVGARVEWSGDVGTDAGAG
jgi:hypothetical protein